MAFTSGHYWIANGASMWVAQWFDGANEVDVGAQWMMANPLPFDTFPTPFGTTQLETGRFQKRVPHHGRRKRKPGGAVMIIERRGDIQISGANGEDIVGTGIDRARVGIDGVARKREVF